MILSCNEASFKTLNSIFASQLYNRSRDIIFIWSEKKNPSRDSFQAIIIIW